ncbi:hypothetical protein GF326_08045 [Candidatus Bathyarchaeota archaeon]|nr:hypothetical protein [Candidatus Bathyarchaeota archaeon]
MPFNKYKIKLVDDNGKSVGYQCELCGKKIYCDIPRNMQTASSAMTNHIKSKHPKEYEEYMGHPPIWRYKNWKTGLDGKYMRKTEEDLL